MAGPVAVTTTTFVVGLSALGLFLFVAEGGIGTLGRLLLLEERAVTRGQLWRFVTYLIPVSGVFGALISMIFFYLIGTQFESQLGRRAFTSLVVALTIIPAVLGALVAAATSEGVVGIGIEIMFFGLAAGFAAANVQARSFFGIPFWALIAFFFVVQLLGFLAERSLVSIVMLFATTGIGLVMTRSLGFSNIEWIPTVPLPAAATGQGVTTTTKPKRARTKKSKRGGANLRAVPTQASEAEIDSLLDQVSEHGIDSLTKQQKQALERHSKEMRKRRDS